MNFRNEHLLYVPLILLIFSLPLACNAHIYSVENVELIVYRDGLVHVIQSLICNETYPTVTIKLLASRVENVLVLDENNSLLDYELTGLNMTVYSLGANRILIEYDTFELTSMESGVWTLMFNSSFSLTVKLPEEATIVYLNDVPMMIGIEGNRTILHLSAGFWEISYVLPITVPSETEPTKPSETEPSNKGFSYPIELVFLSSILGLIIFSMIFLFYKRKRVIDVSQIFRKYPELRDDEKNILMFIANRGGKIFEAELRNAFPDIPRTTLWRMIRRLNKMGILRVIKIGGQNQVELIYK
ncbi:MAG: hypothetical protein NDF54_00670 [archaeon GB-1867-035]|nr:hypothetical protein [Candidatus Culexmicrobium profundum]